MVHARESLRSGTDMTVDLLEAGEVPAPPSSHNSRAWAVLE